MSHCVKLLICSVVLVFLAPLARAANTFDDIQYWVGSGANRAAFVMDWNDGKTSESLIWGYRWDGAATGFDMLNAIVRDDSRLFAHISTPGSFGISLFGTGYDLDTANGFGTDAAGLTFDADGVAIDNNHYEPSAPTFAGDHWQEGWDFGFWGYYLGGTGASPVWTDASSGSNGRTLVNNSWDGWSFAPGFDFSNPSDAVAATPAPEPCGLALVAIAAIVSFKRRRSHV